MLLLLLVQQVENGVKGMCLVTGLIFLMLKPKKKPKSKTITTEKVWIFGVLTSWSPRLSRHCYSMNCFAFVFAHSCWRISTTLQVWLQPIIVYVLACHLEKWSKNCQSLLQKEHQGIHCRSWKTSLEKTKKKKNLTSRLDFCLGLVGWVFMVTKHHIAFLWLCHTATSVCCSRFYIWVQRCKFVGQNCVQIRLKSCLAQESNRGSLVVLGWNKHSKITFSFFLLKSMITWLFPNCVAGYIRFSNSKPNLYGSIKFLWCAMSMTPVFSYLGHVGYLSAKGDPKRILYVCTKKTLIWQRFTFDQNLFSHAISWPNAPDNSHTWPKYACYLGLKRLQKKYALAMNFSDVIYSKL